MTKKLLSKPAKEATVQAYTDLGFTIPEISKLTGIPERTISRYKDTNLEPQWQEFGDIVKKVYMTQDFKLAEMAYQHIKEKIPRARFYELVGLYKIVRELQQPKVPFFAQQFVGTDLKVGFTNDEGETF